jgi:hypothetical protein
MSRALFYRFRQLRGIPIAGNNTFNDRVAKIQNDIFRASRNRDHIRYVTSYESELTDKAAAYDALMVALEGNETQLDAVESYSSGVLQVRLAFQGLG